MQIIAKLSLGIGNARRETDAIDPMQFLEVCIAEGAQMNHARQGATVASRRHCLWLLSLRLWVESQLRRRAKRRRADCPASAPSGESSQRSTTSTSCCLHRSRK